MFKITIVGLDNSGKTSVVRNLKQIEGLGKIHLTNYHSAQSETAKRLGRLSEKLAKFGEERDLRYLTGLAYLTYLVPYFLEEKAHKNSDVLVSDRCPILDTLVYYKFYAPFPLQRFISLY